MKGNTTPSKSVKSVASVYKIGLFTFVLFKQEQEVGIQAASGAFLCGLQALLHRGVHVLSQPCLRD